MFLNVLMFLNVNFIVMLIIYKKMNFEKNGNGKEKNGGLCKKMR